MKKMYVLALIACVTVVGAHAGEGEAPKTAPEAVVAPADKPLTKELYVIRQKRRAKKNAVAFDQAKCEARFDRMDKDNDGVLSDAEKPWKK